MAHIQDRWWRDKLHPETGEPVLNSKGKPEQEKTDLWGVGLRYKVRYIAPNGKERSKSFPDKQLGKAKEFKTSVENSIYAGSYTDPDAGKILFREFTERVLKGRSQDESTVNIMEDRNKIHMFPFFGDKPLSAFDNDLIRDWLGWMAEGSDAKVNRKPPSASYRAQLFDMVSSVLDVAVSEGRLRANPCKDKSISRPKPVPKKVKVWPDSRLRAIGLALPERCKPAVPLGAGLGLRQGEIFAFSLDDVDRERMVYHVNRQVVTVRGVRKFKLPKGHKTRVVPLGRGVLADLDAYAENFPSVEVTLPWAEDDSRTTETVRVLMVKADGGVFSRQGFNNGVWRRSFMKAKLDYVEGQDGVHALRHLYASHMLARGVNIKELAVMLGHASEAFTLRVYAHLMPDSYDRARLAIDHLFKPRPESSDDANDSGDGLAAVHGLSTA